MRTAVMVPVPVAEAAHDVAELAGLPEYAEAAAGDELAVSFDSDDRAAMARVAALFLARVAFLDGRAEVTP